MVEIRRIFSEELDRCFDKWTSHFDLRLEDTKEKNTNQRLMDPEQEDRQLHLATEEADVEPDKMTRKRTEGTSAADRVMNGNDSSARDDSGPTSWTSFGMITEPPASDKSIDDALVDKGAEASKAMSLTRGDAHANSRRWLTAHRHNLYSDEDHVFSTASLELLPDRRDEF